MNFFSFQKKIEEISSSLSEPDLSQLVGATPLQEKLTHMKGKFKYFPEHLEVYARQSIFFFF